MHLAPLRGRGAGFAGLLRRVDLLSGDALGGGRWCSSSKSGRRSALLSAVLPMGHPDNSLLPELEKWAAAQSPRRTVFPGELRDLVKQLRGRKRFGQALEASEWAARRGIFPFTCGDHAVQLDLIGRVRGVELAESYFRDLPEEFRTQKTHGALLNCYVRGGRVEESLRQMERIKSLGFASTALPYNNLMCLFARSGRPERVPALLDEMKRNRILPDALSYRLCIHSLGARNLISEMEQTLEEMDCQPHIVVDWSTYASVSHVYLRSGLPEKASAAAKKAEERMNRKARLCYNHLISLHGAMKNKSEMWRLWNLQEQAGLKHLNRDYTIMLAELVKLGELEEAERLLKNWETSGNADDFRVADVVLAGLCDAGRPERAEEMIGDLGRGGKAAPLPSSWGILARGFARKGETDKAGRFLEEALRGYEPEGAAWSPSPRLILGVLDGLRNRDGGRRFEELVRLLKPVMADPRVDEESRRAIEKIVDRYLAAE